MFKGWKTFIAATLVIIPALAAAFADPAVIAAIPPRIMGIIVALIGGLFAFLRTITTTAPGQSGDDKGFVRLDVLVVLVIAMLASGFIFAQAPPTAPPVVAPSSAPPATVGEKGKWEFRIGGGKMFWTATDTNGFNLSTSDVMGQADIYYWISDHAALGVSAYHDTLFLEPLVPQLPKSSHSLWGFDFACLYTLKTFATGTLPEVPSSWVTYLNEHAKSITVNTIGGIGLTNIAGAPLTATYFLGIETRYWFASNWYASVIADVRYAQYQGVNKTFPETKLMVGLRF